MKFKITIEEHVSQCFEVEANDMKSAMEIADENYRTGKFVLEPGELTYKQMMGECESTNESTEWIEF